MIIKVHLPDGEQLLEQGTLLCWKIGEGARVSKGDILAEIETPKAVIELESPAAGIVSRVLVRDGDVFALKDPVALIEQLPEADGRDRREPDKPILSPERLAEGGGDSERADRPPSKPILSEPDGRILASPAARRLAREQGIDLSRVAGTGPGGRILERDVLSAAATMGQAIPAAGPDSATGTGVPLSPMRRAVASRMSLSKQSIPHFYLTIEVDAGRLWEDYLRRRAGVKVSINDYVIRAAAAALKEFPEVNSRWQEDCQVLGNGINIGIAVHVGDGLRIPVLRDADRLSLEEISQATTELARKAREGFVDGAGTGTFTISNLGMFDIAEFAAIINPPEAAVLAVGKLREAAVVRDGVVAAGHVLSLTLSCDHRVLDGVSGARFLQRIKQHLENVREAEPQ